MYAKLLTAAVVLMAPLSAHAEPLACSAPAAPDAETAKAIFTAYDREHPVGGPYLDQPLIAFEQPTTWSVWHDRPPDPNETRLENGQWVTTRHFGGGMATLEIDKCSGKVLRLTYAR